MSSELFLYVGEDLFTYEQWVSLYSVKVDATQQMKPLIVFRRK